MEYLSESIQKQIIEQRNSPLELTKIKKLKTVDDLKDFPGPKVWCYVSIWEEVVYVCMYVCMYACMYVKDSN